MHELHHAPAPFVPRLDTVAMKTAQEEVMALQREYGRLHREGHTKEADELRIKIDLKVMCDFPIAYIITITLRTSAYRYFRRY
jgi:hypothetical protein